MVERREMEARAGGVVHWLPPWLGLAAAMAAAVVTPG